MARWTHSTMLAAIAGASLTLAGCGSDEGKGGGAGADAGAQPDAPASNIISGAVNGYTASAVDRDVNDPDAPYADNDTVDTAQPVGVPFTLGGYVNAPGAGPDGRSKSEGDVVDVYRVSLEAGQLVMLSFDVDDPVGEADARNALQVYLLDVYGLPVEDADEFPIEGRFQAESVRSFRVETSGDYLLAVQAIKGASKYVLVVDELHGQGGSQQSAPHVGDQLVVRFRPGASEGKAYVSGRTHRGLTHVAGAASRELLLSFDRRAPRRFLDAWGGAHLAPSTARAVHGRRPVRGPLTARTAALLVGADPAVEIASANFIWKPTMVPDDTHYDVQWAFANIHAEQAWDIADGTGVIVAVIDTGIDLDHPDLEDNLVPGYDFVLDADNADDDDGIDPDPSQASSGSHGTHVAGTIAAVTNNGRGVAGLAWGAKVMPMRALGLHGGTEYDVGQALRFAAGLENDSGTVPEVAARVVNMSLGGPESSRWFQRVVYDATRKGTVVVAAAGNDDSDEPAYPAWYRNVISVASTTRSNNKSSFSNYGPTIDIAAPGSQIASTWGAGRYNYSSGTSMACPHAAAWVALMLSANPDLTPADIDDIIASEDVFTDLGSPGRDDQFGHGLIDAHKGVQVAAAYTPGAPVVIPELAMTPDQVVFGPMRSVISVAGVNIGDGTLSVTAADTKAGWLTVSGFTSVDNGVELTIAVDRSSLTEPGIYQSAIELATDDGVHVMPVMAIVRDYTTAADLGRQVVTLATGQGPVASVPVSDGAYELTAVPDGSYRVLVGSDLDNDGSSCGRGETCGANGGLDSDITVSPIATDVDVTVDWQFQ